MKLKILSADYHRNGVGGEPFYAVLFNDLEAEHAEQNPMIATVFQEPMTCAVLSVPELAKGVVEFGRNSWRGDRYSDSLRPLLEEWSQKTNGYGLFA